MSQTILILTTAGLFPDRPCMYQKLMALRMAISEAPAFVSVHIPHLQVKWARQGPERENVENSCSFHW